MARIIDAFTQFFDNAGEPLLFGKLKFLESGTNNTDKDTFKDASMTAGLENTNPVILDGAGRLAFSVFGTGLYNVILLDSDDIQIQQFDPVGATSGAAQFSEWLATSTYNEADIVRVDTKYYESVINNNNNNNPTTSPDKWDLITIVKSYVADAGGSANVVTATFTPVMHALVDKTRVLVRALAANSSTTPTFSPNGLPAKTVVKHGNSPLFSGDMKGDMDMVYNAANDNWELLNPTLNRRIATAWCNFNGSGVVAIRDSENVSSITDNGVGNYTVNFIDTYDNVQYCQLGFSNNAETFMDNGAKLTTSTKILTSDSSGTPSDSGEVNITIFGGLV